MLSSRISFVSSLSYGQQAPPSKSILVKGFAFSGNTVIGRDELEIVTQPYVGQSLDMSALEKVASLITDLYQCKGKYRLCNSTLLPCVQLSPCQRLLGCSG